MRRAARRRPVCGSDGPCCCASYGGRRILGRCYQGRSPSVLLERWPRPPQRLGDAARDDASHGERLMHCNGVPAERTPTEREGQPPGGWVLPQIPPPPRGHYLVRGPLPPLIIFAKTHESHEVPKISDGHRLSRDNSRFRRRCSTHSAFSCVSVPEKLKDLY